MLPLFQQDLRIAYRHYSLGMQTQNSPIYLKTSQGSEFFRHPERSLSIPSMMAFIPYFGPDRDTPYQQQALNQPAWRCRKT